MFGDDSDEHCRMDSTTLFDVVTLKKIPEQGTRQFCRDNVTMFSGHKVVCYFNITTFSLATPSRNRDLTIFRFFSGP